MIYNNVFGFHRANCDLVYTIANSVFSVHNQLTWSNPKDHKV